MNSNSWLNSADALALLGVRPQTLYANVSRKRIRAKPDPDDPGRSLYHAGDVRRLAARVRGRPSAERVAAESVSWGNPVLPSGVSTVVRGRLWYRGVDAVQLAEYGCLEDVAGLLWRSPPIRVSQGVSRKATRDATRSALEAAYGLLASRAGRDPPMYGRAVSLLHAEAADLFADLSDAMIGAIERTSSVRQTRPANRRAPCQPPPTGVHERLARAWERPKAADAIRRALVLLADHELNASTFATRVAASTGAALSASILAGFATLSGPLHGTAALALRELVEAAVRDGAANAILGYLDSGRTIPGFGHPLYPDGDVRARALLERANLSSVFEDLRTNAERLIGELPNVDFALAVLAASTRLPRDAPFILFAVARSVGWIAHALEQSQSPGLIRPRARYVGPAVSAA
jgi:citrate synthase